jgi:hypothetical protein
MSCAWSNPGITPAPSVQPRTGALAAADPVRRLLPATGCAAAFALASAAPDALLALQPAVGACGHGSAVEVPRSAARCFLLPRVVWVAGWLVLLMSDRSVKPRAPFMVVSLPPKGVPFRWSCLPPTLTARGAVGPAAFLIWTLGGLLRRVERPAANDRVHVLTSLLSSRIEAGERRSAILAETEACVKRRKLVRWGSC